MLQNGVSYRCACVKLSTGGRVAPFWGAANLAEKVSRDMGYRSDSIATSRDMRPLSISWDLSCRVLEGVKRGKVNVRLTTQLTSPAPSQDASQVLSPQQEYGRAKGDGPKVTEPNLRFPPVFCENLRFAAKICGFLRKSAPSKCLNF